MASKDVLPLYRRLLKTKAALLAVSFTLIGILLIMLNAWLATLSLGDWSWLHHLPLDEVARLVRETEEFKLNSAVVVIDYLIRHGYLTPDDIPDYPTLCRDIRRIHPLLGQ